MMRDNEGQLGDCKQEKKDLRDGENMQRESTTVTQEGGEFSSKTSCKECSAKMKENVREVIPAPTKEPLLESPQDKKTKCTLL